MKLFHIADREPKRLLAVDETGRKLTCGELSAFSGRLHKAIGGRTLVFLLCENTPGTLLGYLSCLKTGVVPLLLDAQISHRLLQALLATYRPPYLYAPLKLPEEMRNLLPHPPVWEEFGCGLFPTGYQERPQLHPDLALLLTTSGSTGSPKLVRLSRKNLDANACSIAEYLSLTDGERPITNLPMNYSYGMSIVNSHLLVGAPIHLSRRSIMEREFWKQMKDWRITSLAGVPYTYQMLRRLHIQEMDLPDLRTLTQAGGKLTKELHREFAQWAQDTGRRFFVMYGQTEAAPRMGYLPAGEALQKCGSMGIPIPGGTFCLTDEEGEKITGPDREGELVYEGHNVAMGYARGPEELALGDQWQGVLHTGDMAKRDADGYYAIVGRKKRFLKLYGNRVNLDETERLLSTRFPDCRFACVGRDDHLAVFTDTTDPELPEQARSYLSGECRLPLRAFSVLTIEAIPVNPSGKTLYAALEEKVRVLEQKQE